MDMVLLEQININDADGKKAVVKVLGKDATPGRIFFTTRLIANEIASVLGICANYGVSDYAEYLAAREHFLGNVKNYIHYKGYQIIFYSRSQQ